MIMYTNIPSDLFTPSDTVLGQEIIVREHYSAVYDGWIRLKKNKAAVVCGFIIIVIAVLSMIVPSVSKYRYYETDYANRMARPDSEHPFGTDLFGRDQWVRVWYGTRISLAIGMAAAVINLAIGVFYGAFSAIMGGLVDAVMQRIIEILVGIPSLIIVILFMMVLPPGIWTIIAAMAVTGWVNMARLVRAKILNLKTQEFVLAANLLGTGTWKVIFRHLIPNSISIIVIQVMFAIPAAIFTEAFLSFIGVGLTEPKASLGVLINNGYKALRAAPFLLIYPAAAIVLIMVCFSIVGDGLRDAFDPRMRQ